MCQNIRIFLLKGIVHRLKEFKKNIPGDVNLSAVKDEIMTLLETLAVDFNFELFDSNLLR